jgi:hypothetical protein
MTTESDSIDHFLNGFRETIESSALRLTEIPAAQSSRQPLPGKWTPKEILGHLVDSAANNHQRFVHAQFTNDLVFPGYEQDAWVNVQHYNDESWLNLVQLWTSYNLHLLHVVSGIPHSILQQSRTHHNLDQIGFKTVNKSQPTTLEYFVRDYVDHLRHHLAQIFRKHESSG